MPQKQPPARTSVLWPFAALNESSLCGSGIATPARSVLSAQATTSTSRRVPTSLRVIVIDMASIHGTRSRPRVEWSCADETHGRRVHAVAETRRLRAVVEHVTEMGIAATTGYRRSNHGERRVEMLLDVASIEGGPETGPAGARLELALRAEERGLAANAAIQPFRMKVPRRARERTLCVGMTGDFERDRRQLPPPLALALHHLRQVADTLLEARVRELGDRYELRRAGRSPGIRTKRRQRRSTESDACTAQRHHDHRPPVHDDPSSHAYPNVNANACTPASRNSISNVRSPIE